MCTVHLNRLTEESQGRARFSASSDASTQRRLRGLRHGHFVTEDDFRLTELDAGEKLLERAFRHVMAAVFASTFPQRLIENDICFARRADKRGIEITGHPASSVNDTFRRSPQMSIRYLILYTKIEIS
jgi:hypothetical protein